MSHESIGYICTRKTRHLSIIHTNGTDHGFILKCVQKKSRLTNCRFTTISSQIAAIYIFHKTEVQAVILRC